MLFVMFNLTGNKTREQAEKIACSVAIIYAKLTWIYVLWPKCMEAAIVLISIDTGDSDGNKCMSKYSASLQKHRIEDDKKQTKGGEMFDKKGCFTQTGQKRRRYGFVCFFLNGNKQ